MAAPPLFVSHARSRRVPWQSWREWSDVCDALFSAESVQQQLGIDRVRLRARTHCSQCFARD
jgi:hypothetical protein